MSEQTCRVSTCDRPTDAFVCGDCGRALEQALSETPWVFDELDTVIAKQNRYGDGQGGHAIGKAQPLPFDVRASDACSGYAALLSSWVKMFNEENPRWRLPRRTTPPALSRWLMCRVNDIRHHEAGGDCVDELTSAFATCRYVIDRPAERKYAGPCECGKDLYHRPGATDVTCRECERTYNVGELYEWMRKQVMGRLVTAREGATLLSRFDMETAQGTIDKWHERGRIVARGSDKAGRRLYLFDDLLATAIPNERKRGA